MTFPVPPGFQGAPVTYGAPAPAPAPQGFAPGPVPQQGFAPAPAPAPQGYAPAPAPQGYAPQGYAPGPAAAPQQAPVAFGPGAFSGATVTTPRLPSPMPGAYQFKIRTTRMRRERSSTFIADLEIVQSSNPHCPPGMVVGFVQFLHASQYATAQDILASDGGRIGIGQILGLAMASCGHVNEAQFKAACPEWANLLTACFDEKQQLPGNPWPANPLAGRILDAVVTDSGIKTKAKGRHAGGEPIMRFDWRPSVAQQPAAQ